MDYFQNQSAGLLFGFESWQGNSSYILDQNYFGCYVNKLYNRGQLTA